jgi:hypothetical protein
MSSSEPKSLGRDERSTCRREKVHLRGGPPRRRRCSGASMMSLRRGRKSIPVEPARARGLRLSSEKATPEQERELEAILTRYLRRLMIRRTDGLPVEAYAKALGVGGRQAAEIARLSREDPCESDVSLFIDVLMAMAANPPRIAGPLGTRHNGTAEWIFERVFSIKLDDAYRSWQRGGGRISHNDWDGLRIAKNAFDEAYLLWVGRRKR